ncbi:hypothetical protein R1flu_002556 [Riccia fluitans]|uniref:Protein EXORDIUM-like 2 n=1 Tax=Riccia fluitans TaxID=41844 RepID=A0ABD1Y6U0_9MARC
MFEREGLQDAGWSRRSALATLVLLLACAPLLSSHADAHPDNCTATHSTAFLHPDEDPVAHKKHVHAPGVRFGLVEEPTIILDYHFGPVMSGVKNTIKLHVIYYGTFTSTQKNTLRTFFKSFGYDAAPKVPSVKKWWKLTKGYVDLYNSPVASLIVPAGEVSYGYTLGKNLQLSDIQKLVIRSMKSFGVDARSIYLVLTSKDVLVEKFCMGVCGTHFYTFPIDATKSQMVPYGWVGNPAKQCPELCSWPYAPGGLLQKGLTPPNGDVGIDGMIITIANLLAGIGTNPYGNAFFQGDGLEAAGVCQGIYGKNSFPGYPGELLVDKATGASFNVYGYKNAKFLVNWIWNPANLQCTGQA